ncbi:MAG: HAMP domain-containing histidine kinase [Acidobacteria bacterium]|nr:HAMP domain-containing histidine kinase [Acidobacteriota bacterium]
MQSGTILDQDELIRLFRLLSHDLKSPIFSIDGFSELLLADYADHLDEEGRDFLLRIRNGVSQMKTTLDGFSRTVKLLAEPNRTSEVDLNDVIEQVRLKLSFRAEERGVDLEVEGNLPSVEGDPEKLRELFRVLLSNAIEYSDPDKEASTLTVTHSEEDGQIRVSVTDNGIGINPQYHDQIFEAGLRLDKKNGSGSGCGLYLARQLARAHGGTVTVESEEGQGSAFHVTLPPV